MSAPHRSHGKDMAEWERMCLTKARHPDEHVARAAAQHALTHHADFGTVTLFVNRCPNCRGWHMTKNGWFNRDTPGVTASDLVGPTHRDLRRRRAG